ncbi:MAG TPA: biopolymer transporter ExbD [Cryomorphaceae bacterium]|nr:biopolymer transporter ExbD [Cryomorphaceae bacterium]HKL39319.1 biopolymer transporter ExbD [Cryomorphaceae bacterium]
MLPNLEELEVDRIHGRDDDARKKVKREVNVDMNPMVDLAFLLLTFFMLATTFSKPQAMEILVPAKAKDNAEVKETPVKESKTMSLVLKENEIVWYRGITEPETFEIDYRESALLEILAEANANTDGLVVLIKPLSSNEYEDLVLVLDVLSYSGVERYSLIEPSEFDLEMEE